MMSKMKAPAQMDQMRLLIDFLVDCAGKEGFSEEKAGEIQLMTEEILVNVIHYAYPDTDGEVEVCCHPDGADRLLIQVTDEGIPFDPLALPPPNLSDDIDDREIGGLGVFFVKTLAEEVSYRRDGGSNILTVIIGR